MRVDHTTRPLPRLILLDGEFVDMNLAVWADDEEGAVEIAVVQACGCGCGGHTIMANPDGRPKTVIRRGRVEFVMRVN
jgi:hypothetical protein